MKVSNSGSFLLVAVASGGDVAHAWKHCGITMNCRLLFVVASAAASAPHMPVPAPTNLFVDRHLVRASLATGALPLFGWQIPTGFTQQGYARAVNVSGLTGRLVHTRTDHSARHLFLQCMWSARLYCRSSCYKSSGDAFLVTAKKAPLIGAQSLRGVCVRVRVCVCVGASG